MQSEKSSCSMTVADPDLELVGGGGGGGGVVLLGPAGFYSFCDFFICYLK